MDSGGIQEGVKRADHIACGAWVFDDLHVLLLYTLRLYIAVTLVVCTWSRCISQNILWFAWVSCFAWPA